MAAKPETTFSNAVNKKLIRAVYREKTHNPYRGGTPDFYYEGNIDCLWVEYKFWKTVPALIHVHEIVTALQFRWLDRAYRNGRNVAVIVGYKSGGRVFRWNEPPMLGGQFKADLITKEDLALWIEGQVYK